MQEIQESKYDIISREVVTTKKSFLYEASKRILDIIGVLCGLIILSPLLIIIGILIKIDSRGSLIYSQIRVGKDGKYFKMYKFRSMITNADELLEELREQNEMDGPMFKIKDDPRITKIGRFIRRTSIDELPQLLNILKGDMSIVGPRPSLPKEVEQFEPWMLERLEIKPGLTCYWQVAARNKVSFIRWMEMDIEYVRKRSLMIDIELIWRTFLLMFIKSNGC